MESRLISYRQRDRGGFYVEINLKAVWCALIIAVAIAPFASAATIDFSFNGGGITSSGTLTFVPAPDSTSGVSTPGTNEITGITGTFTDSNDGVSGVITGLYTPLSYITPLALNRSPTPPPACLTTICFSRLGTRRRLPGLPILRWRFRYFGRGLQRDRRLCWRIF